MIQPELRGVKIRGRGNFFPDQSATDHCGREAIVANNGRAPSRPAAWTLQSWRRTRFATARRELRDRSRDFVEAPPRRHRARAPNVN
jgi:hypothetical protein